MENGKSATETGVLEPVPLGTSVFENILSTLRSSYLYPDSEQCFNYSSASLINNPPLQEKYSAFHAQKKEECYTDRELEESFGFLMFDDEIKAKKCCQNGMQFDQSTLSTLGDPSKGVYISKYSDCLDLNPWYHGKTGFIVIFRLTKGRVKEVPENYTQNFTQPSLGFDCHISEQIDTVSATTSSFLAYERTQYYLYELCLGGQPVTSPRQACPYAVVRFSYGKTMPSATHLVEQRYIREKGVFQYKLWQGQLQIHSVTIPVALQSSHGALLPAQLPSILKMSSSISVSDLKQCLQQATFETCFTSEGSSCSLYTLIPLADHDRHTLLSQELKHKDMALVLQLKDSGFLVILHSSVFLPYEDTMCMSSQEDALQVLFVFSDSRAVQKDAKSRRSKSVLSQEIIKALPGLSYAEREVENCLPNQQETICCAVERHLQNYATLIQPGMHESPTREASVFPDQYDVPDVIGYLYSAPKWTETSHLRLLSYLEHPGDYTLPVTKVTELLEAGRDENINDQGNDIYYCLSSPENAGGMSLGLWDNDSEKGFGKSPHKVDVDVGSTKVEGELEMNEQLQTLEDMVAQDMSITGMPQPAAPGDLVEKEMASFDHIENANQEKLPVTEYLPQADPVTLAGRGDATPTQTTYVLGAVTTLRRSAAEAPITTVSSAEMGDLAFMQQSSSVVEHTFLHHTNPGINRTSKKISRRGSKKKRRGRTSVNQLQENCENLTQPHLMKRKPYQYGLKTIITDCGKIFVPHGSEIPPGDIKSLSEMGKVMAVKNNFAELATEAGEISPIPAKKAHTQVSPTDMTDRQAMLTEVMNGQSLAVEAVDGQAIVIETAQEQPSLTVVKEGENVCLETENRQVVNLKTRDRLAVPLGRKEGLNLQASEGLISTASSSVTESNNKEVQSLVLSLTNCTEKKLLDTSTTLGRTYPQKGKRKKPLRPISQVSSLLGELKDLPALSTTGLRPKRNKRCRTAHEMENVNFNCENTLTNILQSDIKLRNCLGADAEITEPLSKAEGSPMTRARSRKSVPKKLDLANAATLSEGTQETIKGSATPMISEMEKLAKPFKKRTRHKMTTYMKENGLLSFDTSASYGIDKLCQPQAQGHNSSASLGQGGVSNGTSLSAHRSPEAGPCQPPDALSLLADLALSANDDKVLQNLSPVTGTKLAVMGQDSGTGTDDVPSMSVLPEMPKCPLTRHKLQCTKQKLPVRSPSPKGLVVTGENVLVISKEHSYSFSPSCLLLDLSGPVHVPHLEMSGQSGNNSNDSVSTYSKSSTTSCQEDKGEQIVTNSSTESSMQQLYPKDRRRRFSRMREVKEVHGSLQVKRLWNEKYEFHLDSKYTNDSLEKTVMRALHGPWDYSIEETFEQIRLILHMWIALFYSRSAERFFEIDPNGASPTNGIHHAASVLNSGLSDSEVFHTLVTPLPSPELEALDLREESRKSTDSLNTHSEILDLSYNHLEVLDLTISKDRIEKSPRELNEMEHLTFFHKPGDLPSEDPLQSSEVSAFQFKVCRGSVLNEESEESDDNSSVCEDDGLCWQNSTEFLKNDAACSDICDYIANMFIDSKALVRTQEVIQAKDWYNLYDFQYGQLSDKGKQGLDEVRQSKISYIQSCKFTPLSFSPVVAVTSVTVENGTKKDGALISNTSIGAEFNDGKNDSGKGHSVLTSDTHERFEVHKCSSKVMSDGLVTRVSEEKIPPYPEKNSRKIVNLVKGSDNQCAVPVLDAELYNNSVSVFTTAQIVSGEQVFIGSRAPTPTQGDLSFNHEPNTYIYTPTVATMESHAKSESSSDATFIGNSLTSGIKIPISIPVCSQASSDTQKSLSASIPVSSVHIECESSPNSNYKLGSSVPTDTEKLLYSDCKTIVNSVLLSTEEHQGGSCEPLATMNSDVRDFSALHAPGSLCKHSDPSSSALSEDFQEQDKSRLELRGNQLPNNGMSSSNRKLTATQDVLNSEIGSCLKSSQNSVECQQSSDGELTTDSRNSIECVPQKCTRSSYVKGKATTTDDGSESDSPVSQSCLRFSKSHTNSSENLQSSAVCMNQLTNNVSKQDPIVCNSSTNYHRKDSGEMSSVSSIGCCSVISEEMPCDVNSRNFTDTQFHHLYKSNINVSSSEKVYSQPSLGVCGSLKESKYDEFDSSTNTKIGLQDNWLLGYQKTDLDSTVLLTKSSLENKLQLYKNYNLKKNLHKESACTSLEEESKVNCTTQKIQSTFLKCAQLCEYDSASSNTHPSIQDLLNKNDSGSPCPVMVLKPSKNQGCGGLDGVCNIPQCQTCKCTIGLEGQIDPKAGLTSADRLRTHIYQQRAEMEEGISCDDSGSEEPAECSNNSSAVHRDSGPLSTADQLRTHIYQQRAEMEEGISCDDSGSEEPAECSNNSSAVHRDSGPLSTADQLRTHIYQQRAEMEEGISCDDSGSEEPAECSNNSSAVHRDSGPLSTADQLRTHIYQQRAEMEEGISCDDSGSEEPAECSNNSSAVHRDSGPLSTADQLRTHIYQQHAEMEEGISCDNNGSEEPAECSNNSSAVHRDSGPLSTADQLRTHIYQQHAEMEEGISCDNNGSEEPAECSNNSSAVHRDSGPLSTADQLRTHIYQQHAEMEEGISCDNNGSEEPAECSNNSSAVHRDSGPLSTADQLRTHIYQQHAEMEEGISCDNNGSEEPAECSNNSSAVHRDSGPLSTADQLRTHIYQQHAEMEEGISCDNNGSEEPAECSNNSSTVHRDSGPLSTACNSHRTSQCSKSTRFSDSFYRKHMIDEQVDSKASDYSKGIYSGSFYCQKEELTRTAPTESDKYETEWSNNRENDRRQLFTCTCVHVKDEKHYSTSALPSSIITMVDSKGRRVTYENCPTVKPVSMRHVKTIQNTNMVDSHLQDFLQKWEKLHLRKPDITQDTMDLEYLIFSEKMNQILKKVQKNKTSCGSSRYPWRSQLKSSDAIVPGSSAGIVRLLEPGGHVSNYHNTQSPFTEYMTDVDLPNRTRLTEVKSSFPLVPCELPRHLDRLSYLKSKSDPYPGLSSISLECSLSYQTMMNDICSSTDQHTRIPKMDSNFLPWKMDEQTNVCGETEKEMFNNLQEQLNTVVRRTSKTKFRFYILVTSVNGFFDQTKELLEAEGHVSVDPEQFEVGIKSTSMPLLVILRNEDIAEYICMIPHLLELKKAPSVLFAGVDRPDDILNLTHQELFIKGGFVMCDAAVLDSLMLENMKMLVKFLEELSKKGKWTWFLHYRDCRLLKEKERSSVDAKKRKQFLDWCQEAGIVQTLPYHECDVISREQPDYLHCLLHLQAQYATMRFAVFITDAPDDSFGAYGISVMKINAFLQICRNKVCESVLL